MHFLVFTLHPLAYCNLAFCAICIKKPEMGQKFTRQHLIDRNNQIVYSIIIDRFYRICQILKVNKKLNGTFQRFAINTKKNQNKRNIKIN